MATWPPPPGYAWRTAFDVASVSASLRSASSSSESGRRRARPVRASRERVMYSGFAGMFSRTTCEPSAAASREVLADCSSTIVIGSLTRLPPSFGGGSVRNAVDRHDAVAAYCDLLAFEVVLLRRRPETRRGGRAPSVDAADDLAARHGVMEALRDRRGEALGADAYKGVVDAPSGQK